MRVALVFCPFGSVEQPPTGITCVAAALASVHAVDCFDLNIEFHAYCVEHRIGLFAKRIFEGEDVLALKDLALEGHGIPAFLDGWADQLAGYDVVGFSLYNATYNFSKTLMRRIKVRNPKSVVICGGPFCELNCFGKEISRLPLDPQAPGSPLLVDGTVLGEGEITFRKVLDAMAAGGDWRAIPNVLTIDRGELHVNDGYELCNLNGLPFPDYSRYPLSKYSQSIIPVVGSRGCINRCCYCGEQPYWKKYRFRSAENICAEIDHHIRTTGLSLRHFHLCDSLINGNMKELERLLDLIIEKNLGIIWYGMAAIRKEMTFEVLDKMKRAGCLQLNYGIESGSAKVLRDMRRRLTPDLAARVLADTKRAGIRAGACWIVGFPTETEEDFALTLRFLSD
ncbi:MAG: radical SAM protein, partial [Deltaproteobacteria bacterium]|nr:radical SAM protein [Deltaproteobacteria bacterium]